MLAYYECEGDNMNFWEKDLHNSAENQSNANSHQGNGNPRQNSSTNANMAEQIARLNSMSEEERLSELMSTAGKMNMNGSLNVNDLERLYQAAGMFMSPDQLKKLRTLIDAIK